MPTRSLIAFTGGLDSTYVLHEELKKGHAVEVVYAHLSQGDSAKLAEITARRRILSHFYKLFPGQIKNEWVTISPALLVKQGGRSDRTQLVQQHNTMNALIQVIVQSESDVHYRPMTGWHFMDVMENDPGELQSAETYDLYRTIFKALVRAVDVERKFFCDLLTPAWNVSKQDMWASLDQWTQVNINTGHTFDQRGSGNGAVILENRYPKKTAEYLALGLDNLVDGTTAHFDLLCDLDRYFIGATTGLSDGYSVIFDRCARFYESLPKHSATAVNTSLINILVDRRIEIQKCVDEIIKKPTTEDGPELKLVSNS